MNGNSNAKNIYFLNEWKLMLLHKVLF